MSNSQVSLTITSYLIMQAISPLLWGPMSDTLGRRPVYIASLAVYIVANIALSFSPNYAVLLIFRGVQAAGSASTVSIGEQRVAPIYGSPKAYTNNSPKVMESLGISRRRLKEEPSSASTKPVGTPLVRALFSMINPKQSGTSAQPSDPFSAGRWLILSASDPSLCFSSSPRP